MLPAAEVPSWAVEPRPSPLAGGGGGERPFRWRGRSGRAISGQRVAVSAPGPGSNEDSTRPHPRQGPPKGPEPAAGAGSPGGSPFSAPHAIQSEGAPPCAEARSRQTGLAMPCCHLRPTPAAQCRLQSQTRCRGEAARGQRRACSRGSEPVTGPPGPLGPRLRRGGTEFSPATQVPTFRVRHSTPPEHAP